MHIEQTGQGPDMVLLHGWGLHGGVWRDVIHALQDQFRITTIDLPGHGYSKEDNPSFTLDEVTQKIIQQMQQLALKNIILMGWSLGGLIAQNISVHSPNMISRLILIASVPRFVFAHDWQHGMKEEVLMMFKSSMQEDYRKTVLRFLALQVQGDEKAKQNLRELREGVFSRGDPNPTALQSGLEILRHSDLRHELQNIKHAALCITGSKDTLVAQAAVEDTAQLLPNVQYAVINKAAHGLFLSHQAEFLTILNGFLHEQ